MRFSQEQAINMIKRMYWKLIMFRRMIKYRNLQGVLLCRKYCINPNSGAFEILNVHLIYNEVDYKTMHLRFTIFDYASRQFTKILDW